MQWLSKFFNTPTGKVVGALLAVVVLVGGYVEARDYFAPPAITAMRGRVFICSQTGKTFTHVMAVGEMPPIYSPYSGSNTAYPAEYCYWNADGTTKTTPTPVLINFWMGKPGPTFCPDCGRLVVPQNPSPTPGMRPPPTRAEYERMHAASGQ